MSDLVPDGWKNVKFKDVFHDYKYGPRFSSKDYDELGNVKTIRGTDVDTSGVIKYSQVPTARLDSKLVDDNKLLDGDLVMITTADCGMTAVFYEQAIPYIASAYAIKLSPMAQVSSEFMKLFMQTSYAKTQIESFVRKGTVANLPGSDVMNVAVKLPPLPEQQKIAKILTSVDEVIEKTQAQIDKLKDLKTGMMQELLTNGIGHTKFKDSPVGRIPAEWDCVKMNNVTKVTDGAHFTPTYTTQGVPFLRVTDLKSKSILNGNIKYIPRNEHEELIKRCNPEKGDILFSKNGTIGLTRLIDWDDEFSIFVSLALIKILSDKVSSEYLTLFMESPVVKDQIKKRSKQGSVTNLHLEEIRDFDIPLPSVEEQSVIVKMLLSIIDKTNRVEERHVYLINLKKALMQDLLTGKVRVKVEPTL